MLTPTTMLWTQIGAGVFALLIGTESYGIWQARKQTGAGKSANMALMIVFLALFIAIETVLVSTLANDGKVPRTPGGMPWFVFLLPALAIFFGCAGIVQYVQLRRAAPLIFGVLFGGFGAFMLWSFVTIG